MDSISLKELATRVRATQPSAPRAVDSRLSDYLGVLFTNDPYYTERIDDVLTLHRHNETSEIVGCTIKGISSVCKRANFLQINSGIPLRYVLMAVVDDEKACRNEYVELAQSEFQVPMDVLELEESGC